MKSFMILLSLLIVSCTAQSPAPPDEKPKQKLVCITDTGVLCNHPELIGKLKAVGNAVSGQDACADNHGHGTHVTGIALSHGASEVLVCKNLSDSGSGFSSDSADCIDWCVKKGADIINASWGTPTKSQLTAEAVERAVKAGLVVVASAGNRGQKDDQCSYPGRLPGVINVGAVDSKGQKASFSSDDCTVDRYELGVSVESTCNNGKRCRMSGTSMASPQCAGKLAMNKECGKL